MITTDQEFQNSRLLDTKKMHEDSTEVFTIYRQLEKLGLLQDGESIKKIHKILIEGKFSLEKFLRQREFLANDVKLATSDLEKEIKAYNSRKVKRLEKKEFLKEQ